MSSPGTATSTTLSPYGTVHGTDVLHHGASPLVRGYYCCCCQRWEVALLPPFFLVPCTGCRLWCSGTPCPLPASGGTLHWTSNNLRLQHTSPCRNNSALSKSRRAPTIQWPASSTYFTSCAHSSSSTCPALGGAPVRQVAPLSLRTAFHVFSLTFLLCQFLGGAHVPIRRKPFYRSA